MEANDLLGYVYDWASEGSNFFSLDGPTDGEVRVRLEQAAARTEAQRSPHGVDAAERRGDGAGLAPRWDGDLFREEQDEEGSEPRPHPHARV